MVHRNRNNDFCGFILKSVLLFTLMIIIPIGTACYAEGPWVGTWETKFPSGGARMFLVRDGNQVFGTYNHRNGRIKGTLYGNELRGNWYQDNGSGTIVFTLANDWKSFSGFYDNDNSKWWNGTKVFLEPPVWAGTWDTRWQNGGARMFLVQDGDNVTGTYNHKNGIIKGRRYGNELRGTWHQEDGSGTIVFTISNDGKSFSGYFDNSSWWNGTKIY